jgi:hypothetical protein
MSQSGASERDGAGYETVPESLMRSIKPKLSFAKYTQAHKAVVHHNIQRGV